MKIALRLLLLLLFSVKIAVAQNEQMMFWALNKCPLLLKQITTTPTGAYSLRKLSCAYTGYAIRVRNSSSGATKDIGFIANGDLDTATLKSFIGSNSGTVNIWYDQSGNGRNATQSTAANQPQIVNAGVLITSNVKRVPSILFSGNQWLDCGTSVQTMTNLGADGSVFIIETASTNTQTQFGTVTTTGTLPSPDRWATHINWSDDNLYFDAGNCCAATNDRVVVYNGANVGLWRQYSLVREPTTSSIRISGTTVASTTGFPSTVRCTTTTNFWIGAPNGWTVNSMSPMTGKMCEFIIFSSGLTGANLTAIESNQKVYWATP